jgi:hypothetical protein
LDAPALPRDRQEQLGERVGEELDSLDEQPVRDLFHRFVRGDGRPDPAAANHDPPVCFSGLYSPANRLRVIGIVDGFGAMGPHVQRVVVPFGEKLADTLFQLESRVIGTNGNPHTYHAFFTCSLAAATT